MRRSFEMIKKNLSIPHTHQYAFVRQTHSEANVDWIFLPQHRVRKKARVRKCLRCMSYQEPKQYKKKQDLATVLTALRKGKRQHQQATQEIQPQLFTLWFSRIAYYFAKAMSDGHENSSFPFFSCWLYR